MEDDEADSPLSQPDHAGGDARAMLILQLLLDCMDLEAPNVTHFLLGMDVTAGFDGELLA